MHAAVYMHIRLPPTTPPRTRAPMGWRYNPFGGDDVKVPDLNDDDIGSFLFVFVAICLAIAVFYFLKKTIPVVVNIFIFMLKFIPAYICMRLLERFFGYIWERHILFKVGTRLWSIVSMVPLHSYILQPLAALFTS